MTTPRADSTEKRDSDHALAGRYELIKCLARHGSCSVYMAEDRSLKRTVAVKVLTEQIMSDEELRRFHRGALAACAIKHPNCVQIYDFGTTADERPYMVMEFASGITLRRSVQENGPLALRTVISITLQILEGLEAIHRNGIVHRDLKTANVMAEDIDTAAPQVKILDFGLAKPACPVETAKPITKAGQIVGSPVYMSPEQVRGNAIDTRSDIYSVGCILFELATGEPLFLGKTAFETMSMHALEPPPRLGDHMRKAPPEQLEELVARAVAKEPHERFQSAEEMKLALEAVLEIMESWEQMKCETVRNPAITPPRKRAPNWLLALLFIISMFCMSIGIYILVNLANWNLPAASSAGQENKPVSKPDKITTGREKDDLFQIWTSSL